MTDKVAKTSRSRMMSGISGKDTKPELVIRRGLHKVGIRYRLHSPSLPGKPDLVLPKYRAIILVNGCFWHGHMCHLFKWPGGDRAEFWRAKIQGNVERDRRRLKDYYESEWRAAIVWECALKGKYRLDHTDVIERLVNWLQSDNDFCEITSSNG